jgi:hypothetical protein
MANLQNQLAVVHDITLVTLGELESAPAMYEELHRLVRTRQWTCGQLEVLEGFSWLAGWLERLRGVLQGLLPANNAHAVLHGPASVLPEITRIKREAAQLARARKEINYKVGGLATQVFNLSRVLSGLSEALLLGGMTLAQFQIRIPACVVEIDQLLLAAMQF